MKIESIIKRLQFAQEHYRAHGLAHALTVTARRIFSPNKSFRILFALSTPRPHERALKAAKDHTFKFATVEDLKLLQQTPEYDINDEYVAHVENGRASCLLQIDGEKFVGYAWIWTHKLAYIDDGFHLNLPNDTIYNFKGYTAVDYRGDGFQALRHLKLLELLKDDGVKRLFGFVEYLNLRSLNGVRKSGYKEVGILTIDHKNSKAIMHLELNDEFWAREART